MKQGVNWNVVLLFIGGFLFFIFSLFDEDTHSRVIDLFVSGYYFIYGFSSCIERKIEQAKKEIMDELKKSNKHE